MMMDEKLLIVAALSRSFIGTPYLPVSYLSRVQIKVRRYACSSRTRMDEILPTPPGFIASTDSEIWRINCRVSNSRFRTTYILLKPPHLAKAVTTLGEPLSRNKLKLGEDLLQRD